MWIVPRNLRSEYCHSVLDTEALNLVSNLCWDLCASSLMWRSKPSPSKTWFKRWKRVPWLQHLFGRMLKPFLYEAFQKELSIWLLEATRASHSLLQEEKRQNKTIGTCGHTSETLLSTPDQQCVSLKTSDTISNWDSLRFLQNSTALATRLERDYSQRRKLEPRTEGKESLSWPTPTARDYKGCAPRGRYRGGKLQMDTLDRAVNYYNGPLAKVTLRTEEKNLDGDQG